MHFSPPSRSVRKWRGISVVDRFRARDDRTELVYAESVRRSIAKTPPQATERPTAARDRTRAIRSESSSYAELMSATGDHDQPVPDASVTEAFRQIADIYVEISRELFKSDPDLCLDSAEPPRTTVARTPDWG